MKVKELIEMVKKEDIKIIDFKFTDFFGLWQHFSISISEFGEDLFEYGIGFDGSSIRGFQSIDESDMLLIPDPETGFIDPFTKVKTLSLICNVYDPITMQPYTRDARYIAKKAELYMKSTGIADKAYFGPEAEFFILNDVKFDQGYNYGYYYLDSNEGIWNSGREEAPNLGYKVRNKQGYFPVPPMDSLQDIRTEMSLVLSSVGVNVEVHHHEVATAGQCEIDIKYNTLVKTADNLMLFKYVVKNVARRFDMSATFMPKPIFMDNGSGMHTHQSLWIHDKNIFYETESYGDISKLALYYIGGLLKHAPALCALIAPTTNSYRRLVPGYEAPINLVYSQRNRSACVRIPMYSRSEKSKRIEFRTPDSSCNPYLAFSAMLMAGIDGIINKIDPGNPVDKDLYELGPAEMRNIKKLPGTLDEVLDALENDCDFLLKGDVFTSDVIETWINYKRKYEVDAVRLRPHPYEFALYYDI